MTPALVLLRAGEFEFAPAHYLSRILRLRAPRSVCEELRMREVVHPSEFEQTRRSANEVSDRLGEFEFAPAHFFPHSISPSTA